MRTSVEKNALFPLSHFTENSPFPNGFSDFLIRHIVKTIHLYNWLIYGDTGIAIKNYRKILWGYLKKKQIVIILYIFASKKSYIQVAFIIWMYHNLFIN